MSGYVRRSRSGFTLVEIMIVVLIIGILLAVAVPNFFTAREKSRRRTCQTNLRHIDEAKQQYATQHGTTLSTVLQMSDLAGNNGFLRYTPECPAGGTYSVETLGDVPTCSLSAQGHVVP